MLNMTHQEQPGLAFSISCFGSKSTALDLEECSSPSPRLFLAPLIIIVGIQNNELPYDIFIRACHCILLSHRCNHHTTHWLVSHHKL